MKKWEMRACDATKDYKVDSLLEAGYEPFAVANKNGVLLVFFRREATPSVDAKPLEKQNNE